MERVHTNVYFGPNQYLDKRVIYYLLDLGQLKAVSLQALGPRLLSGLFDAVPGLIPNKSGQEKIKGIETRIYSEKGLGLAKLVEVLALQLQRDAGQFVTFGETRPADVTGQYKIFFAYDEPDVGLKAGQLALQLVASLLPASIRPEGLVQDAFDPDKEIAVFNDFAEDRILDISGYAILEVARQRHIPVTQLDRWPFVEEGELPDPVMLGVLQLGQGIHGLFFKGLQTHVPSPETLNLMIDRQKSNHFLAARDFPVPRQDSELPNLNSAQRALRSAERIGFPVVLKPVTSADGEGVFTAIEDPERLLSAYAETSRYSQQVVVEQYIPGHAYRLFVINGKMIAACRRIPATGSADGGSTEDVTGIVDSEVAAVSAEVAGAFGLKVAGIDLITTDITQPLVRSGGVIIGVDPMPDLSCHCLPGEQLPLDAARRYLETLIPPGTETHVPIAAITGTNGKTTTCRMVAQILKAAGRHVGLACTDGVYIDGTLKRQDVMSGITGALNVFIDPNVDVAVLETSRGTLVKKGLAFEYCSVSACTNVANDHLGLEGIHTLDEMATLKRVVLEKARDMAVLNADDARCVQMLPYLGAERICLVSTDSHNSLIREHLDQGGMAVILMRTGNEDRIFVHEGSSSTHLLSVNDIPATWGGIATFNVENAMFAVGISLGMGVALETIRNGLRGFTTSIETTPGRLNVYDDLPFRVILDYAHNAHGLRSLCKVVNQVEVSGQRILVMFALGDRSDANIADSATAVAGHFDHFICMEASELRGRNPGEVPRILRSALINNGVAPEHVEIVLDLDAAAGKALSMATAGDLLVILTRTSYRKTMDMLVHYQQSLSK